MSYDCIKTTTTSTGTGAISVATGTLLGFRPFSDLTPGDVRAIRIADGAGAWELVEATVTGNLTFTRDRVITGSNGTSLINWGAGEKSVEVVISGDEIEAIRELAQEAKDIAEQASQVSATPGASAYQLAVSNGFVGNQAAWLASLKGDDGDPGSSAYQVAVANGFSGTEADWLNSLKGADGEADDGLSAYQIAVANGFVGTQTAWLASLKGERGEPGADGEGSGGGVDASDVGFDIILLAGQSNMAGRGTLDTLIDVMDPRIFQYGGDSTVTGTYRKIAGAADPLNHRETTTANRVGAGTWAAKAYSATVPTNRRVLLVPVAFGGTSMVGGTPRWNHGNPGGDLYEFAITQANLAITAAQAWYPASRFVGILWAQGETDGDNGVSQAAYATALKTLIAGMRARINGAADSWFIIGGMVPEAISSHAGYPAINLAHIQVANETDKAAFIAGPSGHTSDNMHYIASGYRIMGARYGLAVASAIEHVGVDASAPAQQSAAVANAAPTLVTVAFNETLDPANVPAASAWTVGGHTVTGVAISGGTVNLTVTPAFVNGEAARTVAYTQPGTNALRDAAGNLVASFSGLAITNNVQPVDTTAPVFSSAQVANAAPTQIVITMGETLAASTPPTSAVAVSGGKTVSNVAVSGATVTVTVNSAYVNGDTITVTYTMPGANPRLQDAAGNPVASFGPSPVTNNVAAVGDTTAPVLTSPTAAKTGSTTGIGSVTTANDANGALHYRATPNANEGVATVKAGANQPVTTTGVQNVSLTGLAADTTYYLHFVHTDASGNDSSVASSGSFITDAAPPVTGYDFETDTVGQPPADITALAGTVEVTNTGLSGGATGNHMRFTGAATGGGVYVATLNRIPAAVDRTVIWKRNSGGGGARDGMMLRAGAVAGAVTGYPNARRGYMAQVSSTTNTARVYKFDAAGVTMLGSSFALTDVAIRYWRFSVIGSAIKLEYSANGVDGWVTTQNITDTTFATAGGVDYVNGFDGATPSAAKIDDISWS